MSDDEVDRLRALADRAGIPLEEFDRVVEERGNAVHLTVTPSYHVRRTIYHITEDRDLDNETTVAVGGKVLGVNIAAKAEGARLVDELGRPQLIVRCGQGLTIVLDLSALPEDHALRRQAVTTLMGEPEPEPTRRRWQRWRR